MVLAEAENIAGAQEAVAPADILLCVWREASGDTRDCVDLMRERGWGFRKLAGDALITRSRSRAVSHWYIHSDTDVFLMVDGDVVFAPEHAEAVVQLAREKRSIACAAYPVRDGTHLACRRIPGQVITFGEGQPPVEIIYPATGFMAVHRDVIKALVEAKNADGSPVFPFCDAFGLEEMWPLFDTFAYQHEDGRFEYLSEDYAFGEQALRLGFTTWLAPSVILYHMGLYPYTIENMRDAVPQKESTVITADGFMLHVPNDDVIGQDIRAQGAWDIETGNAILDNLRPGETFLDIGAHVGYFALLAARRGNPVIAIEPIAENVQMMRRSILDNALTNVEVRQCAIAEEPVVSMLFNPSNTGDAHRVPNGTPASVVVEGKRLEDILIGRRPEFVKIDVEGDEFAILAANPDLLDAARAVLFEVCDEQLTRGSGVTSGALGDLLQEHGFTMRQVSDRGNYSDWIAVREDR